MKAERNILIAFILNLTFSLFELLGGLFTGSVAILSDAVHDVGDAAGIGISFFLEKKSKKDPDQKYTYGYGRYSVIGSTITTLILLIGSIIVIYNAIWRIVVPTTIDYDGMIIFAIIGVLVNLAAAFFTREGDSLNQKAVNLHMIEDVLGWLVVLIGAIVMRFTDFSFIDPIMSIAVALFILIHAIRHLKEGLGLLLEKVPFDIDPNELRDHILALNDVIDVHHIHVWSMDGQNNYATMHVVTNHDPHEIKERIREELLEHGIGHVTIELEAKGENCHEMTCHSEHCVSSHHHHHHH